MSQPLTWSKKWRWNAPGLTWNGMAPNQNNNMSIHVSLSFSNLNDSPFGDFALGVHDALVANAAIFTSPPVTPAALLTAQSAFVSALALANKGGVAQTLAKDTARAAVDNLLRQLAIYVEGKALGDQSIIRKAGFEVTDRAHHPQQPLAKTIIQEIKNEHSGALLVRLNPQTNASGYEGQLSTDGGKTWQPAGFFNQARRAEVPNLIAGTTYTFRFRALGGSTGSGDWSDPVSHMAT